MKALKILLDERKQQLDIFEQNKELGNPNEDSYIILLNEAIKELDAYITNYQGTKRRLDNTVTALAVLEYQNKSLVKTLEKYNEEMIDLRKENQDLKNRSCVTCKYGHTYQFDEDIECMKLGADTQGLYFEKDFYCKNWELK